MKGKVALSGMAFYGYHGYYTEENKLGNHYTVDLIVETELTAMNDELESTINYEKLYNSTKEVMLQPLKLLETLAYRIGKKILKENTEAIKVYVKVIKHQPPIGGICDHAFVELELERE
ncbi:dihydroneopterin aldolase [Marivirga sp. S37H4]|uniref:7,8-dihydroneopterin aldolase n=1 Tax=Marivirga aurantiaca TaxID=2802615 RepID=A0A935CAB5_9BACT|nr:dihydroneopterin aldolase [Marivirga aurantiaca]MBK6264718.1 dihydroneopterin aldolase [Marivirga aurantiaca]